MIGPRLFPEHFQVLYLQLTYDLLSQAINFAPHGCVLASLCFSHSVLCFLSVQFRPNAKKPLLPVPGRLNGRSLF